MRFKCVSCGIEFDDIQQLASHKKQHQAAREEATGPKGITCLGCARKIPLQPSQFNYTGPLTCPSCHETLKVTLKNGEVVVATLG
jgi:DNA-directed RNA polymerase subunit RPC12/RpoP